MAEPELFSAIVRDPTDASARMVYADWLEEAGDPRCQFIRQHLRIARLPPDHPDRASGEQELSRHRLGLDPRWLAVMEPERRHHYVEDVMAGRGICDCFVPAPRVPGPSHPGTLPRAPWSEVELHREPQDTECDAWKRLLDYVERIADTGARQFKPRPELTAEQWRQIVTLPATIAKLTQVTSIELYGSYLVRIPPEIGQMTSLRELTPYTSYRLHWFPYEITRCRALRSSTVSTRTLYGNFKYRPPFPRVLPATSRTQGPMRPCSVCSRMYEDLELHRVWISLRVATDVLPLLVNACSAACVDSLPAPADGYVPTPHRGGLSVEQPPAR